MGIIIDKRPIWIILFLKSIRYIGFLLLAVLFIILINLPTPDGLTVEGKRAIAIFIISIILWVTHLLPLAITSLLALILIPLLGIMDANKAYSLFGNQAVFFILGAFILAASMMSSGLSSRIALKILNKFGNTPKSLFRSIFLLSAFLSFFMSEHAVAAMIFPIVLEIIKVLGLKPLRSSYAKILFLAMGWGCVIGGVATLLGGARNPLAIGILYETTGKNIDFIEWVVATFPIVVIMLIIGYFTILKFFKIDIDDTKRAEELLTKKTKELGIISLRERIIGIIMIITIFLWIFFSKSLGIANIAILGAVSLFILRVVRWRDIEDYVNWGIILMYGGAICLGSALEKTGAASWAVNNIIGNLNNNSFLIIGFFSLASLILTEFVSNSAVIAILMPVGISMANNMNIDPKIITYSIALPSGLAFCLPMGTPANAITYSSGFLKIWDMVIPGMILGISAWIVFNIVAYIYWPIIGMRV